MKNVTIDVFMDTVCPWCRMGDASLGTALRELPDELNVTVRYRAYQLNPGIRKEGEDYRKVMIGRLGGEAQLAARMKQYKETGARFGLNYNMDLVKVTPNTVMSHQLIAITPEPLQPRLIENLFTAYFEQGVDLGDANELAEIGRASGVSNDAASIKARLLRGEGLEKVEEDQRLARELGIRGVPFYVVDGKFAVTGLQTPADLVGALTRR